MSYSLDAVTFISEVKKHPEIWNMNVDARKYKGRTGDAWEGVARMFIPDLDSMSDADKFEVYRKLHGKWRNLRDAYVRNLKKRGGKRNYMYAKHLSFLNAIYKPDGGGSDSSEEDCKPHHATRQIELTAPVDYPSEDEGSSTIDNLKRKRPSNTENIEFVSAPPAHADLSYMVEDGDRSFFDSVLPAVREFDMDQKLEFRGEVLKLVKRIRSAPLARNIKMDHGLNYSE